jgi:hypothetical protein
MQAAVADFSKDKTNPLALSLHGLDIRTEEA